MSYISGGGGGGGGREVLTADRTYYVRTDGSDSNDGLANTAGGAFLTIQHAIDIVAYGLDLNGNTVTIDVGNGTYNENLICSPCLGNSINGEDFNPVILLGDTVTPSNVVINGADGSHTVIISGPGSCWRFKGFKVVSAGGYSPFLASDYGIGHVGGQFEGDNFVVEGANGTAFFNSKTFGVLNIIGPNMLVTAPATPFSLLFTETRGGIRFLVTDLTITGAPAFDFVVYAERESLIQYAVNGVMTGVVTGPRFFISQLSLLVTASDAFNYVIGNAAGTLESNSSYNNFEAPYVSMAFADLPASPLTGLMVNITDSNTAVWGATIAGGGANNVLARFNGTNWTVVGI